jgi:biotin synthase-like enzyme
MPRAHVRLSAGRTDMSDETQALCFLAGANSIFYGDKLLTTVNPGEDHDHALFAKLGIRPERTGAESPIMAACAAQTPSSTTNTSSPREPSDARSIAPA